jgi:predicted phosphodiesterase
MSGRDLARKLVEEFPDATSTSLARRLYNENKERFPTLNAALLAVRYVRGNQGAKHRKLAKAPRENGEAGFIPACPPSSADPWKPYVIDLPCRALVLSDAHFPYHEPKVLEAAVAWAKQHFNPGMIFLNGDWLDFYAISRWDKDPKRRNFPAEIEKCKQSLAWIAECFPGIPIKFKKGNHEERWDKFIWNKAPELWGLKACTLEKILGTKKLGIKMIGDQRVVMFGNLPVLHGHELPKGLTNPVNQSRGAFLRTIHSTLTAHGHRSSSHSEPDMFGKSTASWSQGCLCNRNPEYARINKWNWGFATIEADKDKTYNVENYQIFDDGKVRSV